MKKIIAIIALLALVCLCPAFADTDITGTWYADMYGVVMTLDFSEDGTVLLTMSGSEDSESGTWELDGETLYLNRGTADELVFSVEKDALVSESNGITMTREEIEPFTAPKMVESEDLSDFNGTWTLTRFCFNGLSVDGETAVALFGEKLGIQEPTIRITDGTALIFSDNEQAFSYMAGMLYVESPDEAEPTMAQLLALNDDGSLLYDFAGVQFYLKKTDAE